MPLTLIDRHQHPHQERFIGQRPTLGQLLIQLRCLESKIAFQVGVQDQRKDWETGNIQIKEL